MIDNRLIFSLDLAQKAGISWYYCDTFLTTEIVGSAEDQFDFVFWKFINLQVTNSVVLIEDFVYFSGPNKTGKKTNSTQTIKSLIKRMAIVEHLLEKEGVSIQLYNVQSVRNKYFKGKDKKIQCEKFFNAHLNIKLTNNHTDSLLALFWYLDLPLTESNIHEYNIRKYLG